MPIFGRGNERLDHLGGDEVAVELVKLVQPKLVAGVVCVLWIVRVAAQVTKELHQHECAIELLAIQRRVLSAKKRVALKPQLSLNKFRAMRV